MPYTSLELFPRFDIAHLRPLPVCPSPEPSIEKARKQVRIYIEVPDPQNQRTTRSKIVGAYADIRASLRYPRLPSFIEAEVLLGATEYRIYVMARHGDQESIGGSFIFDTYAEAFVHVVAWIWYATQWIGTSWKILETDSVTPQTETVEDVPLSRAGSPQDATTSLEERLSQDEAERVLQRLTRLVTETDDDDTEEDDVEEQ
jgi:hypothetical protein